MVNASFTPEGNVLTYIMDENGEMVEQICASPSSLRFPPSPRR